MPWGGNGIFTRIYSWVADKAAGLDISSTRMDMDSNDIVTTGLGNCLTRDGQGQPTANLPMNSFRHTGVGNGVARTDYAAFGQLQDAAPTGLVAPWAGPSSTVAPTGWLLCYGQPVSRTGATAALFAVCSTTYGSGDGSTTFNVPDLRGTVVAGVDNMGGSSGGRMPGLNPGSFQGSSTHTLTAGEIPAHTHSGTTGNESANHAHTAAGTTGNDSPDHGHPYVAPLFSGPAQVGSGGSFQPPNSQNINTGGATVRHAHALSVGTGIESATHGHAFVTDNGTGGGGAHSIVQPTLGINYIIKQ